MTAKSAPQLLQAQQSRIANVHLGATLFMVAGALVLGEAASMMVQQRTAASAPASVAVVESEPDELVAPTATTVVRAEPQTPSENSTYRALSEFLAKRYKVSQAVTLDLVTIAHTAGQQMGLDPLLIIAVMAIESRFNPIAESVAGAKGLMQIIPKYHLEKFREFGGEQYAVFDPETNILVGSRILQEYLSRTGNLNTALQLYVGNISDDEETYSGKVMNEKQRLQQVLRKPTTQRPDVEARLVGERFALAEIAR